MIVTVMLCALFFIIGYLFGVIITAMVSMSNTKGDDYIGKEASQETTSDNATSD